MTCSNITPGMNLSLIYYKMMYQVPGAGIQIRQVFFCFYSDVVCLGSVFLPNIPTQCTKYQSMPDAEGTYFVLSHVEACFPCDIMIISFFILHMCNISLYYIATHVRSQYLCTSPYIAKFVKKKMNLSVLELGQVHCQLLGYQNENVEFSRQWYKMYSDWSDGIDVQAGLVLYQAKS